VCLNAGEVRIYLQIVLSSLQLAASFAISEIGSGFMSILRIF